MKQHLLYIVAILLLLSATSSARELVITLKNGERAAFHLSEDNKQTACMTLTDDAVTINGVSYARSDFQELRIYKELPEGVDIVDAVQGINAATPADNVVYDISGRRIVNSNLPDSKLQRGIYIVNHKKVVKP